MTRSVIIVHHTIRDGSRYAGSGAIESHADSVWQFGHPIKRPTERQVTFPKLRLGDKSQVLRYGFAFVVVAHDTDGDPLRTVVTTSYDPTASASGTVESDDAPTLDGAALAPALDKDGPEARAAMVLRVALELASAKGQFTGREILDGVNAHRHAEGLGTQLGRSTGLEFVAGFVADGTLIVQGKGPATRYSVPTAVEEQANDHEG